MATDSIIAIREALPPASDYMTYLTVLESHISPQVLPTLNDILQDVELTQNIGWDLIHILLPLSGGEKCLNTIARLGNPREVVLKVTEELQLLDLDMDTIDDEEDEQNKKQPITSEVSGIDKFCTLINLLSVLHPRIKTKFPSRFLSTSLMAILSTFRPSNQATLAVITFVRTISGKKRPLLPGRKSSLNIPISGNYDDNGSSAPDPEAQDEDPNEAAIQAKLLQSFVTHVLEEYINANTVEWSARLQEFFDPERVLTYKPAGKVSTSEAFREQPELLTRDTIVGQLVALTRDLGLKEYDVLFETIYKPDSHPSEYDPEDNYPSSPADIPLSKGGSLFLITSFLFSSILFDSKALSPKLSIFPDHAKLVKQFIGTNGPANIGSEQPGVIDAVLAIGLWLEHNNLFVSGPLKDDEFLQHLQSLSLLSANNQSPTLRYAAHALTSLILHAHPVDRLRLTFITDTLENCPYESLKASAVTWLKEEIVTSYERKLENVFTFSAALTTTRPYLFPDNSALADATEGELLQALGQVFPFHMAVVNFLFLIRGKQYAHVVPEGMMAVVEEIYLGPLRGAQERAMNLLEKRKNARDNKEMVELQLLGNRIAMCSEEIDENDSGNERYPTLPS